MLTWMPMPDQIPSPERQSHADAAGLLYRLTVAFPSWAGGILAVYAIFLSRFSGLKLRLK